MINFLDSIEDEDYVLPVTISNPEEISEVEFYKIVVQKILNSYFENVETYATWYENGCYVKVMADISPDNEPKDVLVSVDRPRRKNFLEPRFLTSKKDIDVMKFKPFDYIPESKGMRLPLAAIAIRNDNESSISTKLFQLAYAGLIMMSSLDDKEIMMWRKNAFRVEILFDDEIHESENSKLSIFEDEDTISCVAHWIE